MVERQSSSTSNDVAVLTVAANLAALARGAVFAVAFAATSQLAGRNSLLAMAALAVGFAAAVGIYRVALRAGGVLRGHGAGRTTAWLASEALWAVATVAMCAAAGTAAVWQAAAVVWAAWATLGVVAWMRGLQITSA